MTGDLGASNATHVASPARHLGKVVVVAKTRAPKAKWKYRR
jgi:hypothetical protein